jgi:hypothetical protein
MCHPPNLGALPIIGVVAQEVPPSPIFNQVLAQEALPPTLSPTEAHEALTTISTLTAFSLVPGAPA